MTPTFEQLFDFVLANKKDKVFRGCNILQIATELKEALDDSTLYYHTESGRIAGMIIAVRDEATRTLNVTRNLAMSLRVLRLFAAKALIDFPDYKLEWEKHDIWKRPNTQKFYRKLLQS